MSIIVEATYDGNVFRPIRHVELPADTKVQLVVVTTEPVPLGTPYSFLAVAKSQSLAGPPDWFENFQADVLGELASLAE